MKYLHFMNPTDSMTRNEAIADERGCGPVTTLWFNEMSHVDGRRAFQVIDVAHEAHLNQAERDALADTLWYQNPLSGDIYVATTGTQGGAGTVGDPVNLATVCSALSTVAAGSTIHIQSGEYVGDFDFIHDGTAIGNTVIIFDTGARIKGSLTINGDYVICRNADIFDIPLTRHTEETGSHPALATHEGLSLFGSNLTIAHTKVQDVIGNGCGFWQPSINSTLYGLWTINNGWSAPDRGHGHSIYTQNESSGSKLIRNCIWAQGYGGGLRAYTTNQALETVTIDRCISINDQLFLGGHSPARSCAIVNNHVWDDLLEIGETDRDNQDVVITNNYVVSTPGNIALTLRWWSDVVMTGNTFVLRPRDTIIPVALLWQLHPSPTSLVIDNNTYYYTVRPNNRYFLLIDIDNNVTSLTIAQWQALGYDVNSTFIEGLPTVNQVFVEHSEYDNDIAHIAIYNWEGLTAVSVDFSVGNFTLTNTYRAYNAMNPAEYHEFVYDGNPVAIPMTGWTRAIPVGDDTALTGDTWPDFGAFVVRLA